MVEEDDTAPNQFFDFSAICSSPLSYSLLDFDSPSSHEDFSDDEDEEDEDDVLVIRFSVSYIVLMACSICLTSRLVLIEISKAKHATRRP